MAERWTRDCRGRSVTVGTLVRVLDIAPSVLHVVPPDEAPDLRSMIGAIFEVYEIDEHGAAWVEKWWRDAGERAHSHSLALAPHEMEVV